jgi:hypothetical protein
MHPWLFYCSLFTSIFVFVFMQSFVAFVAQLLCSRCLLCTACTHSLIRCTSISTSLCSYSLCGTRMRTDLPPCIIMYHVYLPSFFLPSYRMHGTVWCYFVFVLYSCAPSCPSYLFIYLLISIVLIWWLMTDMYIYRWDYSSPGGWRQWSRLRTNRIRALCK